MAKKLEPGSPFYGVSDYDARVASAIQAWTSGKDVPANAAKLAWDYTIRVLCATYDQSYRPEKPHDTTFVEGRRFVGLQLLKLRDLDLTTLRENNAPGHSGRDPDRSR